MGHRCLGQHESDKALKRLLWALHVGKAAAGLDHAHDKEKHQQCVGDGLEPAMDAEDHRPHSAAFESLWAGGELRPHLSLFSIPGLQSGVEVVNDPVSASYFYHLTVLYIDNSRAAIHMDGCSKRFSVCCLKNLRLLSARTSIPHQSHPQSPA